MWRGSHINFSWFSFGSSILVEFEFPDADFCGRKKTTDTDKNTRSKSRPSNNLNPHMAQGRNRSRATLMRDERSHHCAILAPPKN